MISGFRSYGARIDASSAANLTVRTRYRNLYRMKSGIVQRTLGLVGNYVLGVHLRLNLTTERSEFVGGRWIPHRAARLFCQTLQRHLRCLELSIVRPHPLDAQPL